MIIEKLKDTEMFTDADCAVAKRLLDPDFTDHSLTSAQLASEASVSQSAVIRFCQKMGYQNYRSFMLDLNEEKREAAKNNAVDLEKPFHKSMRIASASKSVRSIYERVLNRADKSVDEQMLQRLIGRLKDARMIDVYGIGISGLYGRQLVYDLQSLQFPCRLIEGDNSKYTAHQYDFRTVSLIYSFTGNNPALCMIAKKIRNSSGYCFGIIGRDHTALGKLCSDSICFAPEYYDILDNLSFELAVTYINHVIYAALASSNSNDAM